MTSSLQRQEVRIPAIPLPSFPPPPPPPPVVFFPTLLAPGHLPACIQQTHTDLAGVFPLVIPQIPRVGRESCLLLDYEKKASERESNLPEVTQLGGKGPGRDGPDYPTFSRA